MSSDKKKILLYSFLTLANCIGIYKQIDNIQTRNKNISEIKKEISKCPKSSTLITYISEGDTLTKSVPAYIVPESLVLRIE